MTKGTTERKTRGRKAGMTRSVEKRVSQPRKATVRSKRAPQKVTATKSQVTLSRKKQPTKVSVVKEEKVVTLPKNISVRAQEKKRLLDEICSDQVRNSAYLVSYVCGLSFIAVGSVLSLTSLIKTPTAPQGLTAETISILNSDTSTTADTGRINTTTEGVTRESTVTEDTASDTSTTDKTTTETNTTTDTAVRTQTTDTSSVSDANTRTIATDSERELISDIDTSTGEVRTTQTEIGNAGQSAQDVSQREEFYLVTSSETLQGASTLRIRGADDFSFIELYARPKQSLTAHFVALATKQGDGWLFLFDAANIPNGSYDFFAKTRYEEMEFVSESLPLQVKNVAVVTGATQTLNIGVDREPVTLKGNTPLTGIEQKTIAEQVVDEILQANDREFSDLLKRYAVAVQTQNAILERGALEKIDEKRETLMTEISSDEELRGHLRDIDAVFRGSVDQLEKHVASLEEARRVQTAGESAVDSDMDGVSDIDEVRIYGTDPSIPDTDNDGISDGIEITRGFDPVDPTSEAALIYESPKETFDRTAGDELSVAEVLPVKLTIGDTERIVATIRGRALPNSFVTLYVFSVPTIVTIKTDADGTFSYTFDKELTDGDHDVYVAMTDNTGAIVAQSNPFSFVKEAEAFVPTTVPVSAIGGEGKNVVQVATRKSYNTVLGMGILALGLILLMLGLGVRTKEELELRSLPSSERTRFGVPIDTGDKS